MRKHQNWLGWSKNQFLLNPMWNGLKITCIALLLHSKLPGSQKLRKHRWCKSGGFCMGTESHSVNSVVLPEMVIMPSDRRFLHESDSDRSGECCVYRGDIRIRKDLWLSPNLWILAPNNFPCRILCYKTISFHEYLVSGILECKSTSIAIDS